MRKWECGSGNLEVGSWNAAFDKLRRGKVGTWKHCAEGRRQRTEDRCQMIEDRRQKAEDRRQRADNRRQWLDSGLQKTVDPSSLCKIRRGTQKTEGSRQRIEKFSY
ncbi:hypothetical protein D1AOALGA4SA_7001 [Olavius algarvensis Delta 1 endosymbiont]|nr:hypothetical protein D1AOALGA4SA_7001 [Olavius algarvensis Delta 1 endosymbiont]